MNNQIETKMILDMSGQNAVCLDTDNRFYCWVMYKHPGGNWVSKRPAFPIEIIKAKAILEMLEAKAGIPCKA